MAEYTVNFKEENAGYHTYCPGSHWVSAILS